MITIDSLLDLVKSETYQKQVISPVALFENDNEGWYHPTHKEHLAHLHWIDSQSRPGFYLERWKRCWHDGNPLGFDHAGGVALRFWFSPQLTLVGALIWVRVFLSGTRAPRNEKSDSAIWDLILTQFPHWGEALIEVSNSGWTPRERMRLNGHKPNQGVMFGNKSRCCFLFFFLF